MEITVEFDDRIVDSTGASSQWMFGESPNNHLTTSDYWRFAKHQLDAIYADRMESIVKKTLLYTV